MRKLSKASGALAVLALNLAVLLVAGTLDARDSAALGPRVDELEDVVQVRELMPDGRRVALDQQAPVAPVEAALGADQDSDEARAELCDLGEVDNDCAFAAQHDIAEAALELACGVDVDGAANDESMRAKAQRLVEDGAIAQHDAVILPPTGVLAKLAGMRPGGEAGLPPPVSI